MSLIFFLVKRMLAKAFGADMLDPQAHNRTTPQQRPSSSQPYSQRTANQNTLDVVETMWVGMSADQLRAAFGVPLSKENIAGGEVWIYANLNGQGVQTAITIQNNLVAHWQDIRTPPSSRASPL